MRSNLGIELDDAIRCDASIAEIDLIGLNCSGPSIAQLT